MISFNNKYPKVFYDIYGRQTPFFDSALGKLVDANNQKILKEQKEIIESCLNIKEEARRLRVLFSIDRYFRRLFLALFFLILFLNFTR